MKKKKIRAFIKEQRDYWEPKNSGYHSVQNDEDAMARGALDVLDELESLLLGLELSTYETKPSKDTWRVEFR